MPLPAFRSAKAGNGIGPQMFLVVSLNQFKVPGWSPMSFKVPLEWFATHPSFAEDDHEDMQQLLDGEILYFDPRQVVLRQSARYEAVYLVKSGWLIEYKLLWDGRRQIQNFRLAGEFIGLEALAYQRSLFSVSALTAAEVISIPLKRFEILQRRCPRLSRIALVQTLRTEALLREWEISLGRRSAYERLAHLLLELRRRLSLLGQTSDSTAELPLTQEEIADCFGLTTVYVNRLLVRLRREELVQIRDRKMTILRPNELQLAAGFDGKYLEDFSGPPS